MSGGAGEGAGGTGGEEGGGEGGGGGNLRRSRVSGSLLSLSHLGAISHSLQSVKRSAAICQDMKGANLQQ